MIGIYNCGGSSQPFKEFHLGEWKCLLPLSLLEAQRSFGGRKQFIIFFPAGQWVSLSLLSCPTAAITNKLSFCREEVAETEGLKLASGQQLPQPSLALAKKQWEVVAWPCAEGLWMQHYACPKQNNWPGNTFPCFNYTHLVQGSFLLKFILSEAF